MNNVLTYDGIEYYRRSPNDWIENKIKYTSGPTAILLPPINCDKKTTNELEILYNKSLRPYKLKRILK